MLKFIVTVSLVYFIHLYLYLAKIIWEYLDQLINSGLLKEKNEEAKELSKNKSLKFSDLKKAWILIRQYEKSERRSFIKGKFNVK